MRCVITLVLPLPGPARTSNGPSTVSTASFWAGFSPAKVSISLWNYNTTGGFYKPDYYRVYALVVTEIELCVCEVDA
ncbi:MAG: hypothetical protein HW384_2253 [Dehalococcoidia bacterium]|nr:hypothetical protein [Dehalococcoidia bacterium]